MTRQDALARLADLVIEDRGTDPAAMEILASALVDDFPAAADRIRTSAALLREASRNQLELADLLPQPPTAAS